MPKPHGYRRREPEKNILHTAVRNHVKTSLAQVGAVGRT
jgi:hypothetical protein